MVAAATRLPEGYLRFEDPAVQTAQATGPYIVFNPR